MIRHLGYACKNMTINQTAKVLTDRTCRMDKFSMVRANELALKNSEDLLKILQWNYQNNIQFFRVGSGIFPFIDHSDLQYKISDLPDAIAIQTNLRTAGAFAKRTRQRLSCHPGPYTCLASPNPKTVEKSILGLQMHSDLADLLGYREEFAINIHIGGVYENKLETAKRFAEQYAKLPVAIQQRLTIENDDKASMWSMSDLFELIVPRCPAIKLVLDIHHHRFCQRESLLEAARMAFSTWTGFSEIPKVHYSESRPDSRPQAHSDYIKDLIPNLPGSIQYDVMVEAKAKELAVLQYRNLSNSFMHRLVRTLSYSIP
jgi:UV DNA damage endonuclease